MKFKIVYHSVTFTWIQNCFSLYLHDGGPTRKGTVILRCFSWSCSSTAFVRR